jgi:hypothetical protein
MRPPISSVERLTMLRPRPVPLIWPSEIGDGDGTGIRLERPREFFLAVLQFDFCFSAFRDVANDGEHLEATINFNPAHTDLDRVQFSVIWAGEA